MWITLGPCARQGEYTIFGFFYLLSCESSQRLADASGELLASGPLDQVIQLWGIGP